MPTTAKRADPAPAFTPWEGTLPTSKEPLTVKGTRLGPLVIHPCVSRRDNDGALLIGATDYAIDHIPSGTHIFAVPFGQQKLAKGIAVDLLALPGIDWYAAPLMLAPEQVAEVWRVCHPPPKRRVVKPKGKAPPLTFRPLYPDWFTPSEELAIYDAANAAALDRGQVPPYLAEASQLYGLETLMVRFTAGKRAPLLPQDVYEYAKVRGSRAFATPDLPAGFPQGYAGCRQIIEGLWHLGNRIDALAECMVGYYDTAGDMFSDDQWLAWEREFREYIQKGWANWALAGALFDTLPQSDKAKITGKLGYVGDRRQGYAALGHKTFLRSPHLPRLRECRRLYKIQIEREYDDAIGGDNG